MEYEDTVSGGYTTYDNINSSETVGGMDGENKFPQSLLTFAAVMTFIIMIVGLFGNLLTVIALLKCPKVRNVAAAFIISLCIADLLFCALVLPFSGIRFLEGTWTHGDILCRLIPFIQYGNVGVSLLCIAMITINRYVMIAHHTAYSRIYQRHWIAAMIAFCWLFSYGMQLPTLFGVWGRFGYDANLGTCSIMSDRHGRSSKATLFIIAFVIPCIIIVACYTKIFWVVHESEQRMKRHANKQNSIPNNQRATPVSSTDNRISSTVGSDSSYSVDLKPEVAVASKPSRIKDHREVRAKRNEWRITKMVLAIFLSFVICYLPITIVKVADKNVQHPSLHVFSYILLYLSACINPIIYVIMNKQYRMAYRTVIMCEPSRLLPFVKGAKANHVGEKWKEAGLSNNHSRTMMSQMSAVEQQNTSLSSSQAPQVALEMTSNVPAITTTTTTTTVINNNNNNNNNKKKTNAVTASTNTTATKGAMQSCEFLPIRMETFRKLATNEMFNGSNPISRLPDVTTTTASSSNANTHSTNNNSSAIKSNNNNNSSSSSNGARPAMSKESHPNRIALVGGDIILEEEEEETETNTEAVVEPMQMTAAAETIYVNVPPQRKTPFSGPNINGIPDNETPLARPSTKIK